ncbi:MAG: ABC transporter permease [Proteobacteria bacterium]|nr:ABC transporter permease [Pseudomonadota bacterium]
MIEKVRHHYFSGKRIYAMIAKEFIQIWRDRPTLAMIMLMPIMQLVLFGFAINSDPKRLPTAILAADNSPYTRSLLSTLQNTGYFKITATPATIQEAEALMAQGKVQFILSIPEHFTRDLLRGEKPNILIESDATDPVAVSGAISSVQRLTQTALIHDLKSRPPMNPPFEIRIHNRYNPEGLTVYNIVPGLLAVLLNMVLVALTAVAMAREREHGTLECLLSTPIKPIEVMLGKIAPFIIIAYIQMTLILLASWLIFNVPILGNLLLLYLSLSVYIAANLAIGFTISTFARDQLQAMQSAFFYFLPSMLLSGFIYPFRGMPEWAQYIGNAFPITHALRIIRGIILKGSSLADIMPHLWPMAVILFIVSLLAMKRYKETID